MEQRTPQQNRALHKYFEMLAEALNDAGLDMRATLKFGTEIPWTAENIKNHLWRPVQEIYLKKKSTTELSTKEVSEVYDILNRHLGEKFGLSTPFPHIPDEDEATNHN